MEESEPIPPPVCQKVFNCLKLLQTNYNIVMGFDIDNENHQVVMPPVFDEEY